VRDGYQLMCESSSIKGLKVGKLMADEHVTRPGRTQDSRLMPEFG
jgi:hypothetical protein